MRVYKIDENLIDKFSEKFVVSENTGCWLWTACIKKCGHGVMAVCPSPRGDNTWDTDYANRISYQIYNGPIPLDKKVGHTCTNKHCVNPEHLKLI